MHEGRGEIATAETQGWMPMGSACLVYGKVRQVSTRNPVPPSPGWVASGKILHLSLLSGPQQMILSTSEAVLCMTST